jgi:hypothetical protein
MVFARFHQVDPGVVSLDFASATGEKVLLAIADDVGCRNRIIVFDRNLRRTREIDLETCVVFLNQDYLFGLQNNSLRFYQLDVYDQLIASTPLDELELLFSYQSVHQISQGRFAFFAGEDGPDGHINLYVWNYETDQLLLVELGYFITSAETLIRFSEVSLDELILTDQEIRTTEWRVEI